MNLFGDTRLDRSEAVFQAEPLVIVLMGVCGCGKTTVGEVLGEQLSWPFFDGDDYHPPQNVEKMRRGQALTDADRLPWLQRLSDEIGICLSSRDGAVFACSALKQSYRDLLLADRKGICLVHLSGSPELIGERLASREHQYMPASLLKSQFDALEEPTDAVKVDIAPEPAIIALEIRRRLGG